LGTSVSHSLAAHTRPYITYCKIHRRIRLSEHGNKGIRPAWQDTQCYYEARTLPRDGSRVRLPSRSALIYRTKREGRKGSMSKRARSGRSSNREEKGETKKEMTHPRLETKDLGFSLGRGGWNRDRKGYCIVICNIKQERKTRILLGREDTSTLPLCPQGRTVMHLARTIPRIHPLLRRKEEGVKKGGASQHL
jgi:hypothetical protein